MRDTAQRLDAGPPGFFDDEGACRTPPPTPVFVCLPGTLPPTQFPVTIPGTVTSIEAGNVCTTALGPGVRGYALNVAAASAPPVRVELSLGPLPLPFQVGDEISLTEYGNAGPQAPGPNYSITKNGEIVVYVSQSEPFNGQPPLPVSLEFGKITCTGAEFCGTVTTYNLSASVGADSVQLGIGESARVGVFDVYSGRVASADPNSKCGDWGPRSFIAAFVRRAILDAGMPPGP